MTESNEIDQKGASKGSTSPDVDHPGQATSPPGNGDLDQRAADESQEKLDQAGGGH